MLNGLDLGAARNRLQGTATTALGLLAIVILAVYFVPRQGDIAAYFAERRQAAATAQAPAEAPESTAPDIAERSPVEEPAPPEETVSGLRPGSAEPAPAPAPADPAPVVQTRLLSRPVALDTATILIGRGKVRLSGISSVPLNRRCGAEGASWFCGVEARTQFRAWLRSRSIACAVPADFGQKTETLDATCDLAGEDLGHWLVANGWAEAGPDGSYAELQEAAKSAKRGIWAPGRPGT